MVNYLRFKFIRHCISILLVFSVSNSCNDAPKIGDTKQMISTRIGPISTETDAELLVEVAEIHLDAIKLGELAQRNGQATDIRELGKRLEKVHGQYLETLKELGKKKLIILPLSPTAKTQQLLAKLQKMPKKAFDTAYCDLMVESHQAAIGKFEKIAKNNDDADIQQWANLTLKSLNAQLVYALMHKRTFNKKKLIIHLAKNASSFRREAALVEEHGNCIN